MGLVGPFYWGLCLRGCPQAPRKGAGGVEKVGTRLTSNQVLPDGLIFTLDLGVLSISTGNGTSQLMCVVPVRSQGKTPCLRPNRGAGRVSSGR